MEIEGEHRFEPAPEAVWTALFEPATLRLALPAIESLERIDEDTYELVASVEIRGFWGRFRGLARVTHVNEPDSYHLRLSGAAAEGTAMGQGTVTLSEDGESTLLRYRGDLTVHGAAHTARRELYRRLHPDAHAAVPGGPRPAARARSARGRPGRAGVTNLSRRS